MHVHEIVQNEILTQVKVQNIFYALQQINLITFGTADSR